jgi:hypothetical protein
MNPSITPLRQRMLDDMRMRKLDPKTQASYVRAVRRLARFLERSPDSGRSAVATGVRASVLRR